jgi:hypothetical protein
LSLAGREGDMAETAAVAATRTKYVSSSYRVKFKRQQFLELVDLARPDVIYHRKRMHFFAYDGFVMYTFECENIDFTQKVIEAVEFSSEPWSE